MDYTRPALAIDIESISISLADIKAKKGVRLRVLTEITARIILSTMQNSTRYYDNSQDLITQKELAKAGELLWGAIAEAAKALHLMVKDKPINSHGLVGKYLNHLSLQHSGQTKMAEAANQLHVNFYETDLLQQDESKFLEQYECAKLLFGLLKGKIEIEIKKKNEEKNLV
ncbi:MAG: PaREP1 family protein [Candidatus Nitrosopolaris sp.]|jgi:hypothetical protein